MSLLSYPLCLGLTPPTPVTTSSITQASTLEEMRQVSDGGSQEPYLVARETILPPCSLRVPNVRELRLPPHTLNDSDGVNHGQMSQARSPSFVAMLASKATRIARTTVSLSQAIAKKMKPRRE